MQNNTTTTAAIKKQFNVGSRQADKETIAELCSEFTRPAAVAKAPPVKMSEKEALEVLLTVATDRRFKSSPKVDEDGYSILDTDGTPEMETVDLFEVEWEKIKARDYGDNAAKTPRITATTQSLIEQVRTLGKQLAMSEGEIQAMIHNALAAAKPAAPVEETPAA
jgi:hypothetical protein